MTLRTVGYASFLAFRSVVHDLPEDFVSRLEPGLDEETAAKLVNGLRVLRRLRRVSRWMVATLVLGACLWIASFGLARLLGIWSLGAAFASWIVATGCFIFIATESLLHRSEIHRIEAFVRAMRGSSLARDLT